MSNRQQDKRPRLGFIFILFKNGKIYNRRKCQKQSPHTGSQLASDQRKAPQSKRFEQIQLYKRQDGVSVGDKRNEVLRSSAVRRLLESPGVTWSHLETPGVTWSHLGTAVPVYSSVYSSVYSRITYR